MSNPELVAEARRLYAVESDNTIEVDDDAKTSVADGGVWVQAWVWVEEELEDRP